MYRLNETIINTDTSSCGLTTRRELLACDKKHIVRKKLKEFENNRIYT